MTDEKETILLWCDIETTGLDPQRDAILEIACILTDLQLNRPAHLIYPLVESFDRCLSIERARAKQLALSMNPEARAMHTASGLWETCTSDSPLLDTLGYVEQDIASWLDDSDDKRIMLAGSSPRLDYEFLRYQMPAVHQMLHYRCFDVRTLITAHDAWMMPAFGWTDSILPPPGGTPHRALDDVRWALDVARRFKERIEALNFE